MNFADATNFNIKSGAAKWRACPERSRTGTCGVPIPQTTGTPTAVPCTGSGEEILRHNKNGIAPAAVH